MSEKKFTPEAQTPQEIKASEVKEKPGAYLYIKRNTPEMKNLEKLDKTIEESGLKDFFASAGRNFVCFYVKNQNLLKETISNIQKNFNITEKEIWNSNFPEKNKEVAEAEYLYNPDLLKNDSRFLKEKYEGISMGKWLERFYDSAKTGIIIKESLKDKKYQIIGDEKTFTTSWEAESYANKIYCQKFKEQLPELKESLSKKELFYIKCSVGANYDRTLFPEDTKHFEWHTGGGNHYAILVELTEIPLLKEWKPRSEFGSFPFLKKTDEYQAGHGGDYFEYISLKSKTTDEIAEHLSLFLNGAKKIDEKVIGIPKSSMGRAIGKNGCHAKAIEKYLGIKFQAIEDIPQKKGNRYWRMK